MERIKKWSEIINPGARSDKTGYKLTLDRFRHGAEEERKILIPGKDAKPEDRLLPRERKLIEERRRRARQRLAMTGDEPAMHGKERNGRRVGHDWVEWRRRNIPRKRD